MKFADRYCRSSPANQILPLLSVAQSCEPHSPDAPSSSRCPDSACTMSPIGTLNASRPFSVLPESLSISDWKWNCSVPDEVFVTDPAKISQSLSSLLRTLTTSCGPEV